MATRVSIEAAGDHSFDLAHLRREGACDLVSQLLKDAGFTDSRPKWRLRVDKKLTCTSHTSPISISGRKPWCVYVKVKPGDNNTCHQCSLLVPDGSPKGFSKELEDRLRLVEKQVAHQWKTRRPVPVAVAVEEEEIAVPAAVAAPPINNNGIQEEEPITLVANEGEDQEEVLAAAFGEPEEPEAPDEPRFSVKKFMRAPENVRQVLFVVFETEGTQYREREHFMDMLRNKMGWDGISRHSTGSVIANLVKDDYLITRISGTRIIGYELSAKGRNLIKDLIETKRLADIAARPVPKPSVDPNKVIRSLGKVGNWFNRASTRLAEIETEKTSLLARIAELEKEEKVICAVIDNPKVQGILSELVTAQDQSLLKVQEQT